MRLRIARSLKPSDQGKVEVLEISKPAMYQLGRTAGGAGGKIALFDKSNAQTAGRRIENKSRAGDAAADDQHVQTFARHLRVNRTARSPRELVHRNRGFASAGIIARQLDFGGPLRYRRCYVNLHDPRAVASGSRWLNGGLAIRKAVVSALQWSRHSIAAGWNENVDRRNS